ncbi:MAG: ribonuclease P protein component [Marmoricola sp.]
MLAAENRLTTAGDFREVVRRGHRSGGPVLVVHLLTPNATPQPDLTAVADRDPARLRAPRIGLVVSKAVGNAVIRNLVKRRLRHLIRERLALLPDFSVLVVRAQPVAAAASYAVLGEELDRCLGKVLAR